MKGVYLLYSYEQVVYVGKSTNVENRIAAHKNDKMFNSLVVIELDNDSDMHVLELFFINLFKPEYNIDSKGESSLTIKILMENTSEINIKEYVLNTTASKSYKELNNSNLVNNIRKVLNSITIDNVNIDIVKPGFKYSTLQKTAIALVETTKYKIKDKDVVVKYGVKLSTYKLLKKNFDRNSKNQILFLNSIINGDIDHIVSVPECSAALKDMC